ncbi:protein ROS1A isoform X8 [Zea mays]|uniref:protein ROS1A isoform X8 n=1 Tax=Zea mays TaxID=4577 RepID=UPI0009AAA194|nr:protein ROS1A isoform X8 [Zea mays]|eukprot:XP_020394123.1 protein ROS1 isoform X8 [Zea mays]
MQEELGQRMHVPHGINLCFSTSSELFQVESSIELGTAEVNPVPSEKLSANSQAVRDDAGAVEGIDMNGKPVQKPKRKKHRPKVIKEGQSAKLQKPKTPKPPKENGNQPTGKRKYVRKKGLSTPAKQIPSEGADTHTRAKPGIAQRCLDFDVEDQHGHLDLVSQTQETEIQTGPGDTQPSISGVERSNAQVSCHWGWGGTSSSIISADPIVDIQGLQADCIPKRVNFDLNNSMASQMPTNYSSRMDSSGQFFQFGLGEKVQTNQLLDYNCNLPARRVSHLSSSVDHMRHPLANFDQYISTSQVCTENSRRHYQMPSSSRISENRTAASQYTERVSMGGNFNPGACIGEGTVIKQMAQCYRLPESPLVPPKHNERDVMNGNLNEFSVYNDYLNFSSNSNYQTGAAFGFHDSPVYSDVLAMGKKREHNAISGHQISFDIDFVNSNSTRKFCIDDLLSTSSQTSYYPEACKRMRPENHSNQLNVTTGKLSSSSAFSGSLNTNNVSTINPGIGTLADIQRLMALEKSQASQQMIDFITSQNNMAGESTELAQQNNSDKGFVALHNKKFQSLTAQNIPLPDSTVNQSGESNILRNGIHQTQPWEITSRSHHSSDNFALPNKWSGYLTAGNTQLSSITVNPSTENYIQSNAIYQYQCLENVVAKVPVLSGTHNTSSQEGHNHSTAATNEHIRTTSEEVVRSFTQRASEPTTHGNYNLNSSRVTAEANSTEKPRKRGRPRKVVKPNGEPKERGTKGKQNVSHEKPTSQKGSHTDILKTNGISYASEPSTGITPRMAIVESKSSDQDKEIHGGVIPQATAISVDLLDGIIQKIKLLSISRPDNVVAEIPKDALVPYEGEFGALVAFEGKTKKNRSRAKVNIDPVTTMMWNLLMGPDMGDGAEGLDKDKEKWLDEERKVFRGRVDSFIARMHLVQGDRRFSRWKGSVVDSVVGVFLTQNVSDHLSRDFLLSIRGLGLKSVECVRLLTLHHMAFPVDTNVGRICVRLGWVPLQPLPESLQLHLLEMYPMLEHIQKYLWPRLCKLDQRTLYELHYQMITFGKVFCTKSKPNCNSCPLRAECKHFASAFASARLALPAPEEKRLATSEDPNVVEFCHQTYINSGAVGELEWSANYPKHAVCGNLQPFIEEPLSPEPEPENVEAKDGAIEDFFNEDPDEIPTINLNIEEFTQNLKNYMQANHVEIEYADMSKALVAITPEAASIPTPKLKNVSRLRTEHQVYELPDSHPLLEGFEQREPDDPCPYLLSIWTPGETAQSTNAPKTFCDSGETGQLCGSLTCFSCNSLREMQAQKVRGTLLIPCRTAMRGSFPLNGTYFQVNEVFADHCSSQNPIDVPRSWIWDLPRRTVYFGTSVPTIFRGLTTEEIQQCFWRGFVCVRGFDRTVRAPRPLYARLHFPASKVVRGKKPGAASVEE